MPRVVEAVAALHAEARLAARARAAVGEDDGVLCLVHLIGDRTTDAAVRANRLDSFQLLAGPDLDGERLVSERAGRTDGRAFATGDAGALAHRHVEVEGDARAVALARPADHVVVLDLAGADAAVAEDAGGVIDGDDRRRHVLAAAVPRWQSDPGAIEAVLARQLEQQIVARRLFA